MSGLTFQSFVGATLISFVGPTDSVSQQIKSVGVGDNTSFVVAILLFLQIEILATESVGGTFSLFVGPTILVAGLKNWALQSVGPTIFGSKNC